MRRTHNGKMAPTVPSKILVISDTHGSSFSCKESADVVIHCGDLTEGSTLQEFQHTIDQLKALDAPLKLVIAGNHDWTLDTPTFRRKLAQDLKPEDRDQTAIEKTFGAFGQARNLFDAPDARQSGVVFLEEGTHSFTVENGAPLKVYASPYTPFKTDMDISGFQYDPRGEEHDWGTINSDVDIVITHGPPRGIMDRIWNDTTAKQERVGSPGLFAAVAKAKPKMHCFGHVHSTWGARKVVWNKDVGEEPSFYDAIDNGRSETIEAFSAIITQHSDSPTSRDLKAAKRAAQDQKRKEYAARGFASTSIATEACTQSTIFVNAAVEAGEVPWLIDIDLAEAISTDTASTETSSSLAHAAQDIQPAAPLGRKRKADEWASTDEDDQGWQSKRICA